MGHTLRPWDGHRSHHSSPDPQGSSAARRQIPAAGDLADGSPSPKMWHRGSVRSPSGGAAMLDGQRLGRSAIGAACFLALIHSAADAAAERPNVVYIMVD